MTVGIIGAGNIGGAFATALGKAGIEAVIANSRGPEASRRLFRSSVAQSGLEACKRPRRKTSFSWQSRGQRYLARSPV